MSEEFLEGFNGLFMSFIDRYIKKPDETIQLFNSTDVPLQITVMLYNHYLLKGELVAIENIDKNKKIELWDKIKNCCPDISKDRAIELSKAVWLLTYVTEK